MAENCTFPERDAFAPPDPPSAADAIGDWTPADDAATGKWGKVTESANVDGLVVYGFTEQDPVATPGVYTLKPGGIVGRPWSNPAKEENSDPSVPVDTYIHIFPGLRVEPSGHANVTQHGNSSLSHHTIQEAFIRDGGGGTFALVYNNGSALYTTGPLSLGANATAVKNALEALSNITSVNVSGNGHIGDPYNITFLDSFADIANLTFDLNQTEWSQEWYFKHQPTSGGGGGGSNGTISVRLTVANGNGTFDGVVLAPSNLSTPGTTGEVVLVYTDLHAAATLGYPGVGNALFSVGQTVDCFYTGDTAGARNIVYPQNTASLANATVPGLVSLADQKLGTGTKQLDAVDLGNGSLWRLRGITSSGVPLGGTFTLDDQDSANVTIGGTPTVIVIGTLLQIGASTVDLGHGSGISIGLPWSATMPHSPPGLHIALYDTSGATGVGGAGVQIYLEFSGVNDAAGLETASPSPLPGVTLVLGWVCGGQLSVGNCTYFNAAPAAYTNMTLADIITALDARIAALEGP